MPVPVFEAERLRFKRLDKRQLRFWLIQYTDDLQGFITTVFRKDLVALLNNRPTSLSELARLLREKYQVVEDDLQHLHKSLRNAPYRFVVVPARCNKCGFVFHNDKLHKPGKCPLCKSTWISEPLISVEEDR